MTLTQITCGSIVENYKVEVPWLNCDHVMDQMTKFYDDKYTGDVKVPAKCAGDCPETKQVNFALVASLQSCQSMTGITFCDAATPKEEKVIDNTPKEPEEPKELTEQTAAPTVTADTTAAMIGNISGTRLPLLSWI